MTYVRNNFHLCHSAFKAYLPPSFFISYKQKEWENVFLLHIARHLCVLISNTGRGRTSATKHTADCSPAVVSKSNQSCANTASVISSSYFNPYRTKCGTGIKISFLNFEILSFPTCVFQFQHAL